jgi:hypothetical protein
MDNFKPKPKFPSADFIILVSVVSFIAVFSSWYSLWWPPPSIQRRSQRETLVERVQAAGGWDAVRRDCISFSLQHTNGFESHWRDTNGLPKAIAALRPLLVQYDPPHGCVNVRIFGIHSTGGHSTPYFGLEIDTSTNSAGYKHGTGYDNGGVIGNHHSVANQVVDGIYEIY